jgi:hypothetical protein
MGLASPFTSISTDLASPPYPIEDCVHDPLHQITSLREEHSHVGIVIRDCARHEKNGSEWIAFPPRSYQGADGATRWSPLVKFAASADQARTQFQRLALAAIHAFEPTE